jgi:uncharacterized protein (DUF1697 family)
VVTKANGTDGATHVAFLRAVNVGGRTARKEQLVAAATTAGATAVGTFIASGNLLFSPGSLPSRRSTLEAALEDELRRELGFASDVFVRTRAQLTALAAGDPWDGAVDLATGTYQVGFLHRSLTTAQRGALLELGSDVDHLAASGSELHWHTAGRISESVLFEKPLVQRAIGVPHTWRNVTTVRRLVDKLA